MPSPKPRAYSPATYFPPPLAGRPRPRNPNSDSKIMPTASNQVLAIIKGHLLSQKITRKTENSIDNGYQKNDSSVSHSSFFSSLLGTNHCARS